jgi:transposase
VRKRQRLLEPLYPAELQLLREGDSLGTSFVFRNRSGDKLKILAWMGDGFALYLRRLERGTFAFPSANDASVLVTPTQLAMILGGLDPAKARERPRYKTPA